MQRSRWRDEWVFPDPQDDDFIFPSRHGPAPLRGKPLSVEYIDRVMGRAARLAGITRNVNTYLFRHTRLTEIRKKGVVGKMHNRFAGHADGSKQELVYDHMDNDDMKHDVLEKVYQMTDHTQNSELTPSQGSRIEELEAQVKALLMHIREDSRNGDSGHLEHRRVQAISHWLWQREYLDAAWPGI